MAVDMPSIEILEESHNFPCRYQIKIFGPNKDEFSAAIKRVAEEITGGQGFLKLGIRASSKGKHACVTLDAYLQTAHQVQALYVELSTVEGVRMML